MTPPYVRGVSEAVGCVLTPLGVTVSFRSNMTLKQMLVNPKERIPEHETTAVMYQVPCASCPATYVGWTGRALTNDSYEQLSLVIAQTALVEHRWLLRI